MICLAIDSSTKVGSVAILQDGHVLVDAHGQELARIDMESGEHAKWLPVFADELMRACDAMGVKIDAVAISQGPGSYTGLRIGASLAKGICYGLSVPLLPINTMEILCETVCNHLPAWNLVTGDSPVLCPMIDARRMEVYTQAFIHDGNAFLPQDNVQAVVVDAQSFADKLAEHDVYFFGDGAMKCSSILSSANAHFIDGIVPDARYMGHAAERAYAAGEKADVAYWTPFYLKEYEAKHSVVKGLK